MIENDKQLVQTREAIEDLEQGLAALRRDVLPVSAARFALMAESAEDQLAELRKQVEQYTARQPAAGTVRAPAKELDGARDSAKAS